MQIVECKPKTVYYVTIEHKYGFCYYTRHGKDNWNLHIGESEETVSNYEELESLFQEYIICHTKMNS